MILKIGYQTKKGISSWEYFEDFSELKIVPFYNKSTIYEKSTGKIYYAPNGTTAKEEWTDITGKYKTFLDPESVDDVMYLTTISCFNHLTGKYNRTVCPPDTLYIMNDNGKTIDRY